MTTTNISLMNPLFVNSIDIIEIRKQHLRVWNKVNIQVPFLCLAAEIIT